MLNLKQKGSPASTHFPTFAASLPFGSCYREKPSPADDDETLRRDQLRLERFAAEDAVFVRRIRVLRHILCTGERLRPVVRRSACRTGRLRRQAGGTGYIAGDARTPEPVAAWEVKA